MKRILFLVIFLAGTITAYADDGYKRNPFMDVLNYIFRISVSDTSDMIYGEAQVRLSIKGETSFINFDLTGLKTDAKGMIVDSVIFSECEVKWQHSENRISIIAEKILSTGSEGTIKIIYHGIPADGLIISDNKFGGRTFFSDNWPDRARNYLPCIDHPYDKAGVDFIIVTPSHYEVVASGYMVEESHLPKNMKLTHWREDVPLATKVMAFGAADFDIKLAGLADKIPVWTYVFKENREEGFYDYAAALRPVIFFSELIGPYPYEKLANVQSKTIFGGLENASCIFYSENSVTGKGKAETLMVHEIAHQWFGNSVTENDWHHVWLSEGFATYLTSVYLEMNHGKEKLARDMESDREKVIGYYLKSPSPVVDTTVSKLMRLLNTNSYRKGSWILHMLRHELGDELFWKGIRLFYERFKNRNALTSDFKQVMEEVSCWNLDKFFAQWIFTAGQPDLRITSHLSAEKGKTDIIVEQKQSHLFEFPLELLIKCKEGEFKRNIQVAERITKLTVETEKLNEIIPDPDVKLLFRFIPD